jgi:hypothetical protein
MQLATAGDGPEKPLGPKDSNKPFHSIHMRVTAMSRTYW